MAERRELKFENWQQVRDDLNALRQGYEQVGKWDLVQCAKHLNDWATFPIEGFPRAPFVMRMILGFFRATVGGGMLKKIISEGRMQDGGPTMPATVYAETAQDPNVILDKLLSTIDKFESHRGPIHPSPVFGPMEKDTAEQLQFVHFAHHLSWLVPTSSGS